MNNGPITHTMQPNDTLYSLAVFYQTTVPKILAANNKINPYNIRIGNTLTVYPGENYYDMQQKTASWKNSACGKKMSINNEMRMVWEQHVYWTRMLLISIAARMDDETETEARLMRNPGDTAKIFGKYFGVGAAREIEKLFTEHFKIGGELITALRDGDTAKANELTKMWYANADKTAETFGGLSPYYNMEEMRRMLYKHLELTTEEVNLRLAGKYADDIAAFDRVEKEAMEMADMFTTGIIMQFPKEFS